MGTARPVRSRQGPPRPPSQPRGRAEGPQGAVGGAAGLDEPSGRFRGAAQRVEPGSARSEVLLLRGTARSCGRIAGTGDWE